MKHKIKNSKTHIREFLPFFSPYKWPLLISVFMIIMSTLAMTLSPIYEGKITSKLASDVLQAKNNVVQVDFDYILRIIIFLIAIYLIKTITQILAIKFYTDAIQNSMRDMRDALHDKIHKLPIRYFDNHQFGDVLSRITNDVDAISNALQQTFMNICAGILTLCFGLIMMFTIDIQMALIAALIIPLTILVTRVIVHHSQNQFKAQQNALGNLNGAITEMYTGNHEILLYNKQQDAIQRFSSLNADLRTNAFKAQFISSMIGPFNGLIAYLIIATTAMLGVIKVLQGSLRVGDIQAFIRYIWQVNDPLSQISNLSTQIQSAFAAFSRISEILQEPEEVKEKNPATKIETVKGNVLFKDVSFGYSEDQVFIKNLNINVTSGQTIAIVGPTGAGKTTLINLLLRFYDVLDGAILIDGVNIRDMKRGDLRSMFGMVLQDTWLFSGTIYDNIRYGRLNARKDEIIEAAKSANVHHFIRTMPDGYHSFIDEDANNVSQGEKQLLTIARAILKDPQILILDEATSSVDTRLEKILQEAMKNVLQNRTSFVIAHRLSTIRNADLILVMEQGAIVEQGTHELLMQKKGAYEKLYSSQFADQENNSPVE